MKSQVSVFIIIGIVLIAAFSIITIKFRPEIISTSNTSKKVTESMTNCLMEVSLEGISIMGKQGRIYPTTYLATDELKISYFYFRGKKYMPTIEEYEDELEIYINENIYDCVKKQKYSIETNKLPETEVSFDEKINININYPLIIRSGSGESNAGQFNLTIDLNFSEIYSQIEKVIDQTMENPDWIYLDELSMEQQVRLIRVDGSTLIYVVKKEGDVPFEYRYAVKYL